MKQYVMGLDNGGTMTKAALFDLKGNQISAFSDSTPVETPNPVIRSGIWTCCGRATFFV